MKHSIEHLRTIFAYNSLTGIVTWKIKARSDMSIGSVAGSATIEGYIEIQYRGVRYFAHNLGWALHYGEWPSSKLDHENCCAGNNWISNLRLATLSQNKANSRIYINNTSGFKGVTAFGNRWRAEISVNKKKIRLGFFSSKEAAALAYMNAAKLHFGEFARRG